ncbi:coiled-coil domain-containing protein 170-like [Amphiura filiformis]|uniref:coiled-coil domain-containing protein 170-like n=1 Tax=Amphiura filiformis TaxID=82378 RepID=UPI003B218BDF
MTSYFDKDKFERSLPRISSASRATDRSLTLLDDEIERLRHNHSAPAFGSYSPAPPGHSKKAVQDLHDQVKLYKSELDKKDKLIQDLSRTDLRPTSPLFTRKHVSFEDKHEYRDPAPPSTYLSHLRLSDFQRTELASLQLKNEQLEAELKDTQNKVLARELQIQELQGQMEQYRKDGAQQMDIIKDLRVRVGELHEASSHIETVHSRGEHTISALQHEGKEQAQRIFELESRIRDLTLEREESEQKTRSLERKYNDVFVQLGGVVTLDEESPEKLSAKIQELMSENLTLRGKVSSIEDQMGNTEMEAKAGRETIQRLVAEINKEQRLQVDNINSVEKMRLERDAALHDRNEFERENELLKERHDTNKRAWENTRYELNEHSSKMSSITQENKSLQFETQVARSGFKAFKEALAELLSEHDTTCEPREDDIKERVKHYRMASRENNVHVEALEAKIKHVMSQLEGQSNLHQAALRRSKESEQLLDELRAKIKQLEGDVATGDVIKTRLKSDKERYMEFLQKMANVMNVESMALDMGYDMNGDVLIARVEQLMRGEVDTLADKSTHMYTLQRKVKTLKQQLESKDLHLDLMRKKVNQLEDGMAGKSNILKEKDDYEWNYSKKQKENERLRNELSDAKRLIISMRSELLSVSDLKLNTLSATSTIEEMQKEIMKLEKMKEKQARKIAGMKQELQYSEHEATEGRQRAEESVKSMVDELQATKALLNEVQRRERQLQDFRQVIARMLGMDIVTLAVPDYEIISRLEKLIQAHHSHAVASFHVESSLQDMDANFKQGYQQGTMTSSYPRGRSRPRSVSPSRRRKGHTEVY